jgi:hypothetical protein
MTPVHDTLEVPEQPAPEPSDEEAQLPVPAPQRVKRGPPARKITRKHVTPSVLDDNDGMLITKNSENPLTEYFKQRPQAVMLTRDSRINTPQDEADMPAPNVESPV